MTIFLDTNIVIALLDDQHMHHAWSVAELEKSDRRPAVVSDVVYCEVSVGMPDQATLDRAIADLNLERFPFKDEALFRAGEAFKTYKNVNKGTKTGVLPDFLIGAIAETENTPIGQPAKAGDGDGQHHSSRIRRKRLGRDMIEKLAVVTSAIESPANTPYV